MPKPTRAASIAGLLGAALISGSLSADPVPVRFTEGSLHGFLVIRDLNRKPLAAGDLIEVTHGSRISSELIFHFKDGSIDDENTIYDQHKAFTLIRDHHVQKGPSFEKPMDVLVDVPKGDVTVRTIDSGKEKAETTHIDLPPDLANGMLLTLMKNVSPQTPLTTVSYLTATPKPRIVRIEVSPAGDDGFVIAGERHKAVRFVAKVDIGGLAGVIAPMIGKQPKDTNVWVVPGKAPAFVKSEGPFYLSGPLWTIEMTSPQWQQADTAREQASR